MAVDAELAGADNHGGGRSVLVGFTFDHNGRELLDWALGRVARQGDRVVAVHVCRISSSDICDTKMQHLIKLLHEHLAVYEGFCSLKQILLLGRISQGSSIRRVLVREAEICGATTVVVGGSSNTFSFGSSTSIAKYCAKKLPPTTALIAINSGKIVFEREATELPPGVDPKPILLRSILHPSVGMDAKVIVPSFRAMSDLGTLRLSDFSYGDCLKRGISDRHQFHVDESIAGAETTSISVLVRKLPDAPGWPLLRRAVLPIPDTPKEAEDRNMSVVQWVMRLPNRSPMAMQDQLELPKNLERIIKHNSSSCKLFSYQELQSSTSNFSTENLIGKGGSSLVYKGCLPSGQQVAVKLSKLSEESSREFLMEVDIITILQHDRIVPLIGVCVEGSNLISVYSYFSNGSLEENLHGNRAKSPLPWDIRFKVAIGVAEALSYLHDTCSRSVIHRDVKSANILLSDEFEPQLSDFNLALWAPTSTSQLTHSDVIGTFGYLAPEYFMYGRISHKIDVYAFGVVLLELLTGRKAISDEICKQQESLVLWAVPIIERGEYMDLLDPRLGGKCDEDQMRRMVLAASLCITRAARLRPPMGQILRLLRAEEDVDARLIFRATRSLNDEDDETYPASDIGSHVGLALLDVDDDVSVGSLEQIHLNSLEDYLRGRWSRSSSFD